MLTLDGATTVAVVDLESGEYVMSAAGDSSGAATALMHRLLRSHSVESAKSVAQSLDRTTTDLRSLAQLTGATWYPGSRTHSSQSDEI